MGPRLVTQGYGGYGAPFGQDTVVPHDLPQEALENYEAALAAYESALGDYKDTIIVQENTIQSLEKSVDTWRIIAGVAGGGFVLASIFGLYQWSKGR